MAVCFEGTRMTIGEVHERACRLSNALLARGLKQGDRVLVLLPNCLEYLELDIALAQAGLVRVSLNTRAVTRQHSEIIQDAAPNAFIYSARLQEAAEEILGDPGAEAFTTVIQLHAGDQSGPGADYETRLRESSPVQPETNPPPESLYCLFYTSGTTGKPKGVMLTHAAYVAVALNLLLEFGPVRPGEKILLTQPLSHGGGFFMLPWFMSGAACVVMDRFDADECLDLAERYSVETVKVVPTMLLQLLSIAPHRQRLPGLRQVIYGASPMPARQLDELIALYGNVFTQLYGQAEVPMSISVLTADDHRSGGELLNSAGRAWRGVEVRVVNDDGVDVEPGALGEVIVRGPQIMSGYWQQPDLTQSVLRDGYIRTRDLAEVDERGYLYLQGRTDEMIISGGFNIAPRAVEDVLNRHPAVLESVAIGVPHPLLGQAVAAFVALRSGTEASPDDLLDYCRPELGYQKPRSVRILPQLPRNAYGKIVVNELKELDAAPDR